MAVIGKPMDRVDAMLKVTGGAKYAAEFNQHDMVYAFPVRSTIGKGSVSSFDMAAAEKSSGVIKILTHVNAPKLASLDPQAMQKTGGMLGEQHVPLQADKVSYFGQYIALVIAETYEQARAAAALVQVKYNTETPAVDLKKEIANGQYPQKSRGSDVQVNQGKAQPLLDVAQVKIEHTYISPNENHHPMEPHASVAVWNSMDKLTLYEATQGVVGTKGMMAYLFNLQPDNVHIISPYVGGGFGCKGSQWGQMMLAGMAAKEVSRPVKVVVTRQMMQTNVGRRPEVQQTVALGAETNGKLTVMRHHSDTWGNLSEYFEPAGKQTMVLYGAQLREITYRVTKLNIGSPTFMRAPGETPGTFALESAMDELAHELNIDPLQLRIINHTSEDPMKKHPFSSEYLLDCYRIGAEKFGWSQRSAKPRQKRIGRQLVGYGMATATYPAMRSAASARVQMAADGSVTVMCATQDIGTGTYTVMVQTTADALGIPVNMITAKLGDSSFPSAPVSGGSTTTASIHPAILAAGEELRKDLLMLASADRKSKLQGRKPEEIGFANGALFLKADPSKTDSYKDIMRRNKRNLMEACSTAMPTSGSGLGASKPMCTPAVADAEENSNAQKYSFHSFGAQFVEVWVDEDLGTVRVKRVLSIHDAGTIMNEKTARSQILGGVIYGLGAALMEETTYDYRYANPVTRSFADYHVPVNLDVPPIDVHFIGKPDPHISKIGARGIGEIGTTGVAAAVANAIFNATGKRVRDLPLTPDKIIDNI